MRFYLSALSFPYHPEERGRAMQKLSMVLIGLSAVAFLLAIIGAFTGSIMGISPEGFSRACTNLALIGIGLSVCYKEVKTGT
jgi:hypothetical protein